MKTALLISALAVSLTACAIDPVETDLDETQTDGPDGEIRRLSANALSPSNLTAVTVNVGALTQAYVDAMSQTSAGREVLLYLVGCALNSGSTMSAQHSCNAFTGVCQTITYTGSLGLHSNWRSISPSQSLQRQISSCVLARMNEQARTVTISLRGSAYAMDTNEATSYLYKEGAFFGNVFAGSDKYWGACDADGPTHEYRQCAQDGHCTMAWAGACETACSADVNGNMASCVGANGVTYAQPTTVFLSAITP